jgi:DNA-binding response OmpR family regulator
MARKIVLIEDEENLGKLLQEFLESNDFRVSYVRDGAVGLRTIREEKPDLVLMDLLLPRVHGLDICKAIKSDAGLMHIPVVAMSAVYKTAMDKYEAQRIGVAEFLEKPLNFSELLLKINRLTGVETKPSTAHGPGTEQKMESGADENETLEGQILKLQKDYADQLPDKIEIMENLWGSIQKSTDNYKRLIKFRRLVHKLSGSGKTFGFEDITTYARELEMVLDMIIMEGEQTLEKRKGKIEELLDNLRLHPAVTTGKQLRKMKV